MARKSLTLPIALTAASVAILALVPAAFAGKGGGSGPGGGGGGTTGSYSVTVSPAGPYSFGKSIYVTTTVPVSLNPYIWLKCYQSGTMVLSGDHSGSPNGWYYNWPFQLGPTQAWSSGPADCTVTVVHSAHSKFVTDATTSFHVDG